MIDNRLLIGAGVAIGIFLLIRLFFVLSSKETEQKQELARILESDEFKVRGRFD